MSNLEADTKNELTPVPLDTTRKFVHDIANLLTVADAAMTMIQAHQDLNDFQGPDAEKQKVRMEKINQSIKKMLDLVDNFRQQYKK